MPTKVIQVDPLEPDADAIAEAAAVVRAGGLVAFPTETVYGLGANALDAEAAARIFAAKGRPPTNPVIVHLADLSQLDTVVAHWPAAAERLAAQFWPGPLSLVLPKHDRVPAIVTANGPTVAVRMPAHPVAEQLLRAAGVPIAAPSANRSTGISPTTAAHVLRSLSDRIDLLLEGGTTARGLESTVLDLTVDPPRLLRPGVIGPAELSAVLGCQVVVADDLQHRSLGIRSDLGSGEGLAKSPGLSARHYAPSVPVECVEQGGRTRVAELCSQGLRVGWLCWVGTSAVAQGSGPYPVEQIVMPREPAAYATRLYAALHRFEELEVDRILVDLPPAEEGWLAVRDRLRRASSPA